MYRKGTELPVWRPMMSGTILSIVFIVRALTCYIDNGCRVA